MKELKIPAPLLGLISGAALWSCVVAFVWLLYPIKPEGWEAAGFILMFLGLPSSALIQFYKGPVVMQVLLMSLFGYIQWPLLGFIIGTVTWKRNKVNKKKI